MRLLLLSTALFLAIGSNAHATECLRRPGSNWVSAAGVNTNILLSVASDSTLVLEVEGRRLSITERQVSPDQQTMLLWWEGGEGVLMCEGADRMNASFFDRRIPVRRLVLVRQVP